MVHIVGAGAGDPELITVRGQRLLREADVVIYAGSLVNPALLKNCRSTAEIFDSAKLTLNEVLSIIERAESEGKITVRLHTGDPALYGAIQEQMDALTEKSIPYDVTPGVSSFLAAAASLKQEYTLPGVTQTVIITRAAGRTAVPDGEEIKKLAAHRATMCIFLSIGLIETTVNDLLAGGYEEDTPVAVVEKASWPEEKILRGTLKTIAHQVAEAKITRTAMIVVGDCLSSPYELSRLYDPSFSHTFRK